MQPGHEATESVTQLGWEEGASYVANSSRDDKLSERVKKSPRTQLGIKTRTFENTSQML